MENIPMIYKCDPLSFVPIKGYGCIYRYIVCCEHPPSEKPEYIGQTAGALRRRHWAHKGKSSKYTVIDKLLKNHTFTLSILWTGKVEDLDDAERFFIQYYDTLFPKGLNMEGGGKVNRVISAETRRKMSEKSKLHDFSIFNKKVDMYTIDGEYVRTFPSLTMASATTGVCIAHISQCISDIRVTAGGYRWTFQGQPLPPLRTHKDFNSGQYPRRRVLQYTKDMELVAEYSGITEAARATGFIHQGISRCASGERKAYKGFIWKYADE